MMIKVLIWVNKYTDNKLDNNNGRKYDDKNNVYDKSCDKCCDNFYFVNSDNDDDNVEDNNDGKGCIVDFGNNTIVFGNDKDGDCEDNSNDCGYKDIENNKGSNDDKASDNGVNVENDDNCNDDTVGGWRWLWWWWHGDNIILSLFFNFVNINMINICQY